MPPDRVSCRPFGTPDPSDERHKNSLMFSRVNPKVLTGQRSVVIACSNHHEVLLSWCRNVDPDSRAVNRILAFTIHKRFCVAQTIHKRLTPPKLRGGDCLRNAMLEKKGQAANTYYAPTQRAMANWPPKPLATGSSDESQGLPPELGQRGADLVRLIIPDNSTDPRQT